MPGKYLIVSVVLSGIWKSVISIPAVLKACNFIKIKLQHRGFPVNIPKVLGTAFLKERLCWLLLVSKRILKSRKLVEGLPLLYLVSCANTRACKQVNYHKGICLSFKIYWILLSQSIWNLSQWQLKHLHGWTKPLWSLYNWKYKDLSMSRDQKVMTLLPQMEKCPMVFYQGVVFTAYIW